ncbi:hypothetical protein HYS72_03660 [Candidatus Pacearchaeota archaeon]|nr:hypothetical protein [Candidatus Pacearchaeota archaeon]
MKKKISPKGQTKYGLKTIQEYKISFMKNKNGELSTQQIVLMVILIASFIVILFFLFRLGIGEKSEEQLCHNSVLQKASVFSEAPLQCYRDYVCITKDGSCGELIKPEKIKVKSLDEVYGALADEMANCWWMFGEGKINYAGSDLTKNNYCSICSQIYLDDSLESLEGVEDKKLSKDELYDYLTKNNYSKEQTYSQYLLGTNDIQGLKTSILQNENNKDNLGTFGKIEIGKQYFNVMGIISDVGWAKWTGVGAAAGTAIVGAAWILSGPPGWIAGAIIVAGAATAGGIGGPSVGEIINLEIGAISVEGASGNTFMSDEIILN